MRLWLSIGCMLLWLNSGAQAHAHLSQSVPAEQSKVLGNNLKNIQLTFTEELEVRFSNFKVYPLANIAKNTSSSAQQLNGLAASLTSKVLPLKNDLAQRLNLTVTAPNTRSNTVVLPLKQPLKAGYYVVMWKVASVDTHVSQDFYVFQVQ